MLLNYYKDALKRLLRARKKDNSGCGAEEEKIFNEIESTWNSASEMDKKLSYKYARKFPRTCRIVIGVISKHFQSFTYRCFIYDVDPTIPILFEVGRALENAATEDEKYLIRCDHDTSVHGVCVRNDIGRKKKCSK